MIGPENTPVVALHGYATVVLPSSTKSSGARGLRIVAVPFDSWKTKGWFVLVNCSSVVFASHVPAALVTEIVSPLGSWYVHVSVMKPLQVMVFCATLTDPVAYSVLLIFPFAKQATV